MEDVDCIHLAQDRGEWRALVKKGINYEYQKAREISWLPEEFVAS